MSAFYRLPLIVSAEAIDANGHANNVAYLQWMQDAAIAHSDSTGGSAATSEAGASWVVRTHHLEYLHPAFAGEALSVITWVASTQRASSVRRYLVVRDADEAIIVRGETHWVFVDSQSGRPKAISASVAAKFLRVSPESMPPEAAIVHAVLSASATPATA